MNSLRVRLLLGLLLAIVVFCAAWFASQVLQMSRLHAGLWDRSMQSAGQQILLSLPQGLAGMQDRPGYSLPAPVRQRNEQLSYQVWLRDGRSAQRSGDAPATPWVPLNFERDDSFAQVVTAGTEWRVYVVSDAQRQLQVQVATMQHRLDEELAAWRRSSLVPAGLLVIVLAAVVAWVVRRSLAPVAKVRSSLAERGTLDLRPVPAAGLPDELRPLVESFNRLLTQLDNALQGERRFIADAAHELRTPLAALMAQAQLAQSAPTRAQTQAALAALMHGIQRSARLTEQLLDLARLDTIPTRQRRPVIALHELVAMVVREFDPTARNSRQRLLLHAEPCSVEGDIEALGVLLRNVVDNALRYCGHGACIEVRCQAPDDKAGPGAVLSVFDDGPGVPTAERTRIFDRFYRVAGTPGRGSGIGLSLVARIAQMHGARIEVTDGLGGFGLGVTLRFARSAAAAAGTWLRTPDTAPADAAGNDRPTSQPSASTHG